MTKAAPRRLRRLVRAAGAVDAWLRPHEPRDAGRASFGPPVVRPDLVPVQRQPSWSPDRAEA